MSCGMLTMMARSSPRYSRRTSVKPKSIGMTIDDAQISRRYTHPLCGAPYIIGDGAMELWRPRVCPGNAQVA
jgi:hypothetical protein